MEVLKTGLPDRAHVPGRNARHPAGLFDGVRARAPDPTRSETAAQNVAFQAGLDWLEAGYFWEAHEVLEPVWMNAPANTPERFLVQALIQLANAALKQAMDRPRAALRLCAIAGGLLDRAGPAGVRVMDLDTGDVRTAIADLADAVRTGEWRPVRVRPDTGRV